MKIGQILILFIILLHYSDRRCYALAPPPDNARITVIKGGTVMFNFNAMDKYANGVTLNDWTILKLSYADLDAQQPSLTWSFTITAIQTEIKMDGGLCSVPLEYMDFDISIDNVVVGTFNLSTSPIKVLDKKDFLDYPILGITSHEIKITYRLGTMVNRRLTSCPIPGCPSGFYYVDLDFQLNVE